MTDLLHPRARRRPRTRAVPVTLALGMLVLLGSGAEVSAESVTIDFGAQGRPISPWLASANVNNVHYREEQDNPRTRAAIASLRMNFIRFQSRPLPLDEIPPNGDPGEYIVDREGRKWVEACLRTARSWNIGTVMICPGSNLIVVADKEGKSRLLPRQKWPRLAQAMARAARLFGPAEGRRGIEYWELFNEPRPWLEDREALGELVGLCARAMKRANPRVKVGGPAWSWFSVHNLMRFLDGAGDSIDFLSWHRYGTGSVETPDESLLAATSVFAEQVRSLSRELKKRGIRKHLKLLISEYHVNYHAWDPWDPRVANNFAAVWAASVLGHLAYTDIDGACIHDVRIAAYGLVGWKDGTLQWRPIADTYWLYNHYFRGWAVPVRLQEEGGQLEVFAARDTAQAAVFIVNKARGSRPVKLNISGLPPSGTAPVLVVTRDSQGIRARHARWPARRPADIDMKVPARSLTVCVFPSDGPAPAPPSVTGEWVGASEKAVGTLGIRMPRHLRSALPCASGRHKVRQRLARRGLQAKASSGPGPRQS